MAACATLGEKVHSYFYNIVCWLATPIVRRTATLSFATWNINSLDLNKLLYFCMLMLQDSIDVVVLTDTRHYATRLKAYVQLLH